MKLLVNILFVFIACTSPKKYAGTDNNEGYIITSSGLKYKILKKGTGESAKAGQEVLIFETTGYLNGTVLYTNENTTQPINVLIGGNQATDAVDEALRGMQTGEIRKLIAPPELVKRKTYPAYLSPDSALTIKIILYKIL
jgi:FKBP-type peptidyl-prolyl cis-trans isomerase